MDAKEKQYGITEYITPDQAGFDGKVKDRVSDFLVNEVDLDGRILRLTETGYHPATDVNGAESGDALDPAVTEQIDNFIKSKGRILEIAASSNKDERRKLHQQIEALYPQFLRAPKMKPSGEQYIEITHGSAQTPAFRRQEATRMNRSASGACNFIHCTMYKDNLDTLDAVSQIGKALRLPPKCIQYAGVKDKYAKTVQRISVKFRDPARLAKYKRDGVLLGHFSFEKDLLKLGELSGNRFRLIIRDIPASMRNVVEKSASAFSTNGFVNYFGLQRFGTTDVATSDVGKALLQSNWTEAVALVMKKRGNDHPAVAKCRAIYAESGDAGEALRVLGRRSCVESFILQALSKDKAKDPFGAFQAIPRNMRMLYVHSYQSLLWNQAASFRIKTLGKKPVVGDLVLKFRDQDGGGKRVKRGDQVGEDVRTLIDTDLEHYTMNDVVIPLPGYDVTFPSNDVAPFLLGLMNENGLDLRNRHKVRDYSLSGSYRHVVARPKDMSWKLLFYDDPLQDLQLSDGDTLLGRTLPTPAASGPRMALAVQFTLASSVYATVALRELMKRSSETPSLEQSDSLRLENGEDAMESDACAEQGADHGSAE